MSQPPTNYPSASNSKLFYGYIVVTAAFFIMIAYAAVRSAFGIFFDPMSNELGWNSASMSSAFSISILIDGSTGILMGRLADRFGPRAVMTFSGCLIGIGYILMSRVDSLWQMYLVYGLVIGIGSGAGFVPIITNIARWFVAKRSLMTGIVLTGMGIGMLLISPLTNWLISRYQWRESYIILGIGILLIMVIAAQFLKRDPAQVGQHPDNNANSGSVPARTEAASHSLKEAMRTRQFWVMFAIFGCLGFVSLSLIVHLVPSIIHLNISASTGAIALAVMGGSNIIGRLLLGPVADRIGNRKVYIIGFIIMTLTVIWLITIREAWAFYVFALIFGFGQGGLTSSQSPIVAEIFGVKYLGLVFGTCAFGTMVGGAIGPLLIGRLFDVTGGYQIAFITCAVVCALGMVLSVILTRMNISRIKNTV